MLDIDINSLEERFTQLSAHHGKFGFINSIKSIDQDTLLTKCINLQEALIHENHCDIEVFQLHQELLVFRTLLPEEFENDPLEKLKYITTNFWNENFPNIFTALRIALTLPVSVASGERSFSKLKIIKDYMRSTMSQERLVGLAMMSIEEDILLEIDIESIINDFAEKKARKVIL